MYFMVLDTSTDVARGASSLVGAMPESADEMTVARLVDRDWFSAVAPGAPRASSSSSIVVVVVVVVVTGSHTTAFSW